MKKMGYMSQVRELGKVRMQNKAVRIFVQYIGYLLLATVVCIIVYNVIDGFGH